MADHVLLAERMLHFGCESFHNRAASYFGEQLCKRLGAGYVTRALLG